MNVNVMGAGFVGVTTAVSLAERGHRVRLVEIDERRRRALAAGQLPFFEAGLEAALKRQLDQGHVRVAARLDAGDPPDVIYLCVGTPRADDGSADLGQIEAAAREAARIVATGARYTVIAVKSTVPPGTTRDLVAPTLKRHAGGEAFGCAANPEFLREGSALVDARAPSRTVIGAMDERAANVLRRLWDDGRHPVLVLSTPEAAELVKYASNGFLATKIAFANEIANLAEPLGLDVDEVMAGVGLDPRIGPDFLQAGCGFGGSCFPKDVAALLHLAETEGVRLGILERALQQNDIQPLRVVDMARRALSRLDDKRIALLGLAFKPGTSDVRETRALPIWQALRAAGADVVVHDPQAAEEFTLLVEAATGETPETAPTWEAALEHADACIIQTAWPEYVTIPPFRFRSLMRQPVVIDGRRALPHRPLIDAGVRHLAIGIGIRGTKDEGRDPRSRLGHKVPARDKERPEGDVTVVGQTRHPVRRGGGGAKRL